MAGRLGRRVVHFANLPIKLLMPSSFTNITEIALKTIPSASKIEIKRVLESLYGFEVEKVQTLNMEVIEEDKKELNKQKKTSFVEQSQNKKSHWLEGDGIRPERSPPRRRDRRVLGGDEMAKFPWTAMRSAAAGARIPESPIICSQLKVSTPLEN
ncbi:hypothetical protein Cgig2_008086 [Carnegiea gigantea]|uniref:Large ribosomal subunit protein uL23m n=1 Tax=Carnegiea gigantea TaxID=171969 RepID=A0A9Q1L0E9_9CARY|nr:hypothetical protein Cgig2_008086 [Carnegiea gigantea]